MYGYIYLTTNLVNGKKYIGKHKSNEFVGNKYIGSGKLLLRDKECHNFDSEKDYRVELLESCDDLDTLNKREMYWISYYNAMESKDFYNIANGGEGGDISLYMSEDDIKTIRKNHSNYIKNRLENDKNFREQFAGAKLGHNVKQATKDKISQSQSIYWANVDSETKHKRLSNVATKRNIGRVWITNDIIDKFVYQNELEDYLSNGFRVGRKFKKRNRKCATTIESVDGKKNTIE